jgi:hypothetical protein
MNISRESTNSGRKLRTSFWITLALVHPGCALTMDCRTAAGFLISLAIQLNTDDVFRRSYFFAGISSYM